MFRKNNSERQ
uniref:Uncharacterized protein n=1 Tax=Anguilla anguilla TaxID=7936 RepID=A0A0E9V0C2_ANGAN